MSASGEGRGRRRGVGGGDAKKLHFKQRRDEESTAMMLPGAPEPKRRGRGPRRGSATSASGEGRGRGRGVGGGDAKKLHLKQKRDEESASMILPGAPEPKRRRRGHSPASGPRIFLPGVLLPAEDQEAEPLVAPAFEAPAVPVPQSDPPEVEALGEPFLVACTGSSRGEPLGEPAWEPQPGCSWASPGGSWEPTAGPSRAPPSRPPMQEIVEFIVTDDGQLLADSVEIRTSTPLPTPVPKQRQPIAVQEPRMEQVAEEWLMLSDAEDDGEQDIALNRYFNPISYNDPEPVPVVDEEASTADPHLDVVDQEDISYDAALRNIAPTSDHDFSWSNDEAVFQGHPEIFTGSPGPTFPMSDQTSIVDVFHKMVDADFVDMLVTETNRYAVFRIASLGGPDRLTKRSRLNRWVPTDRSEMYSFLAILILQGLYPLPDEEYYFKFNGFGTMPYFKDIMSYDRFLMIKSMLHFIDNSTADQTSRTWKIDNVVEYFNSKFSSLYYPSKEIVIDESLLKWCGRLGFSQKISTKAAGVGVKTYELCESSTGYLWKCILYAGKQVERLREAGDRDRAAGAQVGEPANSQVGDSQEADSAETAVRQVGEPVGSPGVTEVGGDEFLVRRLGVPVGSQGVTELEHEPEDQGDSQVGDEASNRPIGSSDDLRPRNATASIVYQLVEPLLNLGHTLIMDNFYNSPLLARCLKRQKTDVYGTLRLNREFVPASFKSLSKSDLSVGDVRVSYSPDVMVMVWRDTVLVGMISTYHRLRIGVSEKYRTTYKPSLVLDYNKSMGGVDRKDQFLSAHPMERPRNRVWYKKVFRRLLNAAIFNAWIIYGTCHRNVSHRRFRTLLAEDLLHMYKRLDLTALKVVKASRPCVIGTAQTRKRCPVPGMHFPESTPTRYARCWLCSQDHKVRRTTWRCRECGLNFCLPDCFRVYHTAAAPR